MIGLDDPHLLGQLGVLTMGLMMGIVLLGTRPDSERSVAVLTIAPTDRRRMQPEKSFNVSFYPVGYLFTF